MTIGGETEIVQRLTRLEADFEHQDGKLAAMSKDIAALSENVRDLVNLLNQAKGAKWMLVGLATLGGFVAGKFGWLISLKG